MPVVMNRGRRDGNSGSERSERLDERNSATACAAAAGRKAIQITVKFYGNYRSLIDTPEAQMEIADDATPFQLVGMLAERFGEKLRAALIDQKEGRLRSGVRIAVGEEVIDFATELHRPLLRDAGGAERPIRVFIFPPLMGGR